MKTVQIILPVYNEEENIKEIVVLIDQSSKGHEDIKIEYFFVDDCSKDASLEIIRKMALERDDIKYVSLAQNVGHQRALTCGIEQSTGDAIILMDCDLQDDPMAVPVLLKKWKDGFKTVLVERGKRAEGYVFRVGQFFFYNAYKYLSNTRLKRPFGVFCLMDRQVVNFLRQQSEFNRYLPGLIELASYKRTFVKVDRFNRSSGGSRVGYKRLTRLAMDAIFSFSEVPLHAIFVMGITVAGICVFFLIILLIIKLFTDLAIPGWTSILGAILLVGGLQLTAIGVVGEYVARIYQETKQRPLYFIAESNLGMGGDNTESA